MRGNHDGMRFFPPRKVHAYLDGEQIKTLVDAVKPGFLAPGNLERVGDRWRLRVTFSMPEGGSIRRAVTIHDTATAEWVRNRIEEYRRMWRGSTKTDGARRNARDGAFSFTTPPTEVRSPLLEE